jgi:glycosyltransferase involved in cell wall biosynthesis
MRIAQVSPLYESVPPKLYGGTERVVSYLTEELVRQGHDVTLFASGDSVTSANLISPCKKSLRLDTSCQDYISHHVLMLEQALQMQDNFDIIHFHIDYIHYPTVRRTTVPTVTTLHGRQDLPDLKSLYKEFDDVPLISISDSQRRPIPHVNWQGTVYHGLPPSLYSFSRGPGSYLAFLGRISPEKRLDRAMEIARRAGIELRIAAKVDKVDQDYFDREIKPHLNHRGVVFLGEIGEDRKEHFLGKALALLFPIDWPEPFGLVMIESFACGTPVIAYPQGSVPEVIDDGVTGFICVDIDQAVAAVKRAANFDRLSCRKRFEERFSSSRMAQDYLSIYRRLAGNMSRGKKLSRAAG